MPAAMKTPGVYIVEKDAFPNSIVEVATAVPAFIGYTEKADNKGKSLSRIPKRISSMAEFRDYFGGPPPATFAATKIDPAATPAQVKAFSLGDTDYQVVRSEALPQQYLLYYSMMLFFQNGGGPCYIVSVGGYGDTIDKGDDSSGLLGGINLLLKEQEPTMVVIPDAVHLAAETDCIAVQQAALQHCGVKMQSRIAILDIYDGYKEQEDCIAKFRDDLGINQLSYGAAYYPWLNTNLVTARDLGFRNVNADQLTALLTEEATERTNGNLTPVLSADDIGQVKNLTAKYTELLLNKTLIAASPVFSQILAEIAQQMNQLPPSAAIAGIYTMVDGSQGVWKAPANVSVTSVVGPTVSISHDEQENLNVDIQGKSINAIRAFPGEGVLIWGARTLDGNSLDWRYVNVRRTMIMLEQSIKLATKAYVFDNNVANTWVTIKSMIGNFLTGIWKRGGLMGAVPDDAFAVFCGLGETMTADDVLEGILRVTVLVAMVRPAEFIEITFQQQLPKS